MFTANEARKCTGKMLGPKGQKVSGADISWERRKKVRAV
jgi:hypothetical protein